MERRDNRQDDLNPLRAMPFDEAAIRLHPLDDVAVAKRDLHPGDLLLGTPGEMSRESIQIREVIPAGHKVALRPVAMGEPVRRYGQVIGMASQDIVPGAHVHVHNLGMGELTPVPVAAGIRPSPRLPFQGKRTFLGYERPDGRVGTRNYVAVLSTVNCSAHAARAIASYFTPGRLRDFPHVDGVVPFTHQTGCTFHPGSKNHIMLQRTLAGIARHPNVGGYLLVGLGCETNQIDELAGSCNLRVPEGHGLVIQELGGMAGTVEAGVAAVQALLPRVNAMRRTSQPLSELVLALQCGGSDGWSGVTANPVVGLVADEVVREGGTVVLAETPEIYGAEHLLAARAATPELGKQLLSHVAWWQEYARLMGMQMDDNRGVGNMAGGLTTIYEKSLGAMIKAGSTPLMDVYEYAEPIDTRGFVFMDSPGNDPIAVTGQVAGGCNLVLFATGRGSVFGFKPAPSIKIASNSPLYKRMSGDMDLNAGQVLEGETLESVAASLLALVIAVASGQPSKSEAQGVGEAEFCPWHLGGIL
jgi:altronate dehydratase